MKEEMNLQFCTEIDVGEALLRKALWRSIWHSWRKVYYFICGAIYVVLLAMLLWLAVDTGDYSALIKGGLLFAAVAVLLYVSHRMAVKTSLRRWKEQNHEEVVHLYAGFTDAGFIFGKGDHHSLLHYSDMYKVYEVDGAWIIRTRAGQLVFYHAVQLSEADRDAVLTLLKQNNPKIKVQIKKKK